MRADPVSDDDRDAEATLLRAARAGDELAFRSLVEPRLAELRAYCYRMLGSMHDADDVVQETLLRAWRGLARFEGRSTLRSWLCRIATNACLTALGRRSRRALPMDLSASSDADRPLDEARAEQIWLEPFTASVGLDARRAGPEARYELLESVELAFVAAVHELPPNERAALVLRDVLAFSAREVADLMVTSTAAVNSALQRARQRLDGRLPTSQQRVEQSMGDERVSTLVQRYMDAMRRADVDAVVALQTEDATWSMPPI